MNHDHVKTVFECLTLGSNFFVALTGSYLNHVMESVAYILPEPLPRVLISSQPLGIIAAIVLYALYLGAVAREIDS